MEPILDNLRSSLRKPLRLLGVSRLEAQRFSKVVALLTWRQIQVLQTWAEGEFSITRTAAMLTIGLPAASRLLSRAKARVRGIIV